VDDITTAVTPEPPPALSARETEILRLIADGLTGEEIAGKLTISVHTVKSHMARIMDRLGAESRAQAVAIAYERRILRATWDTGRAGAQLAATRDLASRWAAREGAGRDAVLRDAGRALLRVLDGGVPR
jgi:DNA-binding CsgD family transcriptional regulator